MGANAGQKNQKNCENILQTFGASLTFPLPLQRKENTVRRRAAIVADAEALDSALAVLKVVVPVQVLCW
jgi:hypothetical protein